VRDIVKAYYDKKQGNVPQQLTTQTLPIGALPAAALVGPLAGASTSFAAKAVVQKQNFRP
jgi:hypothetical protein